MPSMLNSQKLDLELAPVPPSRLGTVQLFEQRKILADAAGYLINTKNRLSKVIFEGYIGGHACWIAT